jgi:hypothetical protein
MLSPMILVVVVYSMVDYLVRTDSEVMVLVRREVLERAWYGTGAAMAWFYFAIVAVILAVVCGIISRVVYYYD